MKPPLVSFVTWNRMGLTVRNLKALLNTDDDFELHIVDNNSQDCTWAFLQNLNDNRIKSRKRFDANKGPIYAVNYNLAKRKRNQYFITVDNDVNIHTPGWITKFLKAFKAFPDAGLLGAVSQEYYKQYRLPIIRREKDGIYYLQMTKGFVEGCCQCFRPGLLDILGYWCEENCMGDMEMSFRICNFTAYKAGFLPSVEIDQTQLIPCDCCEGHKWCDLDKKTGTCFKIHGEKYRNPQFRWKHGWKYYRCIKEMNSGKRPVFCASIHDKESLKGHCYNRQMAEENFRYYTDNAN